MRALHDGQLAGDLAGSITAVVSLLFVLTTVDLVQEAREHALEEECAIRVGSDRLRDSAQFVPLDVDGNALDTREQ